MVQVKIFLIFILSRLLLFLFEIVHLNMIWWDEVKENEVRASFCQVLLKNCSI